MCLHVSLVHDDVVFGSLHRVKYPRVKGPNIAWLSTQKVRLTLSLLVSR